MFHYLILFAAASLCGFLLTAEAFGAETTESFFNASESCYGREYSPEHLKAHPQQKVEKIYINRALPRQEKAWLGDTPLEKPVRVMRLLFSVRGQDQLWEEFAGCELEGSKVECSMECDAGQFSITARADGKILLTATSDEWYADCGEGERTFNTEPDDKAFLMSALPINVCLPE